MATRSRIGIENEDGTIRSIYCHWDGNLNSEILKNHYTDRNKINELLDLGDISMLGKELNEVVAYDISERNKARIDFNIISFLRKDMQEFNYIFRLNNDWVIYI
jgi:hypothetical protein